MKKALWKPSAFCPMAHKHTAGPVDAPTADYAREIGRVEVYRCTVCGETFGLDRSRMFVPVPKP